MESSCSRNKRGPIGIRVLSGFSFTGDRVLKTSGGHQASDVPKHSWRDLRSGLYKFETPGSRLRTGLFIAVFSSGQESRAQPSVLGGWAS